MAAMSDYTWLVEVLVSVCVLVLRLGVSQCWYMLQAEGVACWVLCVKVPGFTGSTR